MRWLPVIVLVLGLLGCEKTRQETGPEEASKASLVPNVEDTKHKARLGPELDCGHDPWMRKDAFRCCASRIAAYPGLSAPRCNALHMCANEAPLNSSEQAELLRMMEQAGCEPP